MSEAEIHQLPLKHLNRSGFFPFNDEDEPQFRARIRETLDWSKSLGESDLIVPQQGIELRCADRLPADALTEMGADAEKLYGILPDWVPAYFSDKGLPPVTGGMAVQYKTAEEAPWRTFFQLKGVFRHRPKWLIYRPHEIVSHEMCHIARAPLGSTRYEETLAYQTSSSPLRRYLGGALVNSHDSALILISLLWMLVTDTLGLIFFWPFTGWIGRLPIFTLVGLGLLRNHRLRKELRKAENLLKNHFPTSAREVLFRLKDEEVRECSEMDKEMFVPWWEHREGFRGEWLRSLYPIDKT